MPSIGYTTLTSQVASAFGIATGIGEIDGGQRPRPRRFAVEGDWSSAAYLLAAAALTGTPCTVRNLDPASRQPDRHIMALLAQMGIRTGPTSVLGGALAPVARIDLAAAPDLFPVACILAAAAGGTTRVTGSSLLRGKESDRIAAMRDGVSALGHHVVEHVDGLTITRGPSRRTATIDAHGDHRVHMAFRLASLAGMPCVVSDPHCTDVSFPGFQQALERFA